MSRKKNEKSQSGIFDDLDCGNLRNMLDGIKRKANGRSRLKLIIPDLCEEPEDGVANTYVQLGTGEQFLPEPPC